MLERDGVAVLRAGLTAYATDDVADHGVLSALLAELDEHALRSVAETLLLAISVLLDEAAVLDTEIGEKFDRRIRAFGLAAADRDHVA